MVEWWRPHRLAIILFDVPTRIMLNARSLCSDDYAGIVKRLHLRQYRKNENWFVKTVIYTPPQHVFEKLCVCIYVHRICCSFVTISTRLQLIGSFLNGLIYGFWVCFSHISEDYNISHLLVCLQWSSVYIYLFYHIKETITDYIYTHLKIYILLGFILCSFHILQNVPFAGKVWRVRNKN